MKILLVSYYTENSDYPKFGERLKNNLNNLGIDCHIPLIKSTFNRKYNMNLRWKLLYDCMKKFDRPLLWLDVDSEILKGKEFFDYYDMCCENYDFVAGDKINQPNIIFENEIELRRVAKKIDETTITVDNRWRGTQQFFNNTDAGKEVLNGCFRISDYKKNKESHNESIITLAVRKAKEKFVSLRTSTLPPEFMVTKRTKERPDGGWMCNEYLIKELRDTKLDWDDPRAVIRYVKINTDSIVFETNDDRGNYIPDKDFTERAYYLDE